MSLPYGNTGSLCSSFLPARTCRPPSQAPFCHYTLRTVTDRPEGTFRSLRYAFGGDHPSQTARQAMSSIPGVRTQTNEGTVFQRRLPHRLAPAAHCLLPILHNACPRPMLSCSKGSRGLFVPSRVIGIFTDTTISLGSRLRQRPDHYTIRAGRNLPDKEFRYLRTVIVTYRRLPGLQFKASLAMTSPLNLPAPGRCQAVYGFFRISTALCFW